MWERPVSSESVTTEQGSPAGPIRLFPPIAGFWRRLGAWIVDVLLLGLVGQIIGWSLSFIWFRVGPYGRPIGLLFILPYFGLLNSKVGNGETLGKRLLKTAVRNSENEPIGIGRSLLRISVLTIPAILNGWALPILQRAVLQWIVAVTIFGVGGAVLYTMVFNRRTRQGLHDLICGTYVLHLTGEPIEVLPRTARVHLVICGVLTVLVVVGATTAGRLGPRTISATRLASLSRLQQALQADTRFFGVGVTDNTLYAYQAKPVRSLQIQAWYKGVPPEGERVRIVSDVARVALANAENLNQYDVLSIGVVSAFDIGIASGYTAIGDRQPVAVWQQRVSAASP